mmetsp:Transcript_8908/g.21726  ORF Transcript_8908/g.21726 Transcript_8908/m.21726 type:complete len:293 (+) Transcript_8908:575-1453(+)
MGDLGGLVEEEPPLPLDVAVDTSILLRRKSNSAMFCAWSSRSLVDSYVGRACSPTCHCCSYGAFDASSTALTRDSGDAGSAASANGSTIFKSKSPRTSCSPLLVVLVLAAGGRFLMLVTRSSSCARLFCSFCSSHSISCMDWIMELALCLISRERSNGESTIDEVVVAAAPGPMEETGAGAQAAATPAGGAGDVVLLVPFCWRCPSPTPAPCMCRLDVPLTAAAPAIFFFAFSSPASAAFAFSSRSRALCISGKKSMSLTKAHTSKTPVLLLHPCSAAAAPHHVGWFRSSAQ